MTADEDEIDPLDAFMSDINKQVEDQNAADRVALKLAAANANADGGQQQPDGQSASVKNFFDENEDEVPDYDSEDELKITPESILALANKKAKRKEVPTVDHSKINYRPFRKAFYVEPVEYGELTEVQVDEMRLELSGIKIRGKDCPKPIMKWSQAGLNTQTSEVIRGLGFDGPTPIQSQAIPAIMSGRDVIGVAKTGSGKTIAFLLPLFRHIKDQRPLERMDGPMALILTPTRELAVQIHRECKPFLRALHLRAVCAYGGSPIKDNIADFKRGAEIVVCTPGRLIDILTANQGRVTNLRRVTYVVLDEADRMFDMGFEPQVMKILGNIRPDRQTVLFSATFPKHMEALARKILRRPVEITVGARSVVPIEIHQIVEVRPEDQKFFRLLEQLGQLYVDDEDVRALIFVDRQEGADALLKNLMAKGYPCMSLHGGKDQYERDSTIQDFKNGVVRILTATSVAARGLDVKDLNLVVNYDCPNHMEDYVHRVGRTGRAGQRGTAVTFITPDEGRYAVDIIKALKSSGAEINPEVQKLADQFLEKVRAGRERASGIGFGGKGLERFDKDRDLQRKLQRRAFGDEDEEEEDEEIQPDANDLFADTGAVETDPSRGSEPLTARQAVDRARQAIANINSKLQNKQSGATDGNEIGEFQTVLDINEFPQKARWAVTNRTNLVKILDQTGVSITTRGNYYGPGKAVPPGEAKLHLFVEGETQKDVEMAMKELRRLLMEATTSAIEGESRIGSVGRYQVIK